MPISRRRPNPEPDETPDQAAERYRIAAEASRERRAGAEIARQVPPAAVPATTADPQTAVAIPAALLERIIAEVQNIPDGDDGDSWGMIEQLLASESAEDLNRPWDGTSGRDLENRRFRITGVTKRPSAFDGGPEIFLVVHSTDMGTGEAVTWTTSSLAVIVQLAVAHNRAWFPIVADITPAAKPTKRGFRPYHLTVVRIKDGR